MPPKVKSVVKKAVIKSAKATKRPAASPSSTRLVKQAKTTKNNETIEVTINQTPNLVPTMDENLVLRLHPHRAVQTPGIWSPTPGPILPTSAPQGTQSLNPQVPQIWPLHGTQQCNPTP